MTAQPTVLLTGAAHGIGRATAEALVRQGTPLGLIDYDGAALAELAQTFKGEGATVAFASVDVSDRTRLDPSGPRDHGDDRTNRRAGRLRRDRHANARP